MLKYFFTKKSFIIGALALFLTSYDIKVWASSNDENTSYYPLQLSIFDPIQIVQSKNSIIGLRLNALMGNNKDVAGIDIGLWNLSQNNYGIQAGLIHNEVKEDFWGIQLSLIKNKNKNMTGLQVGLVNETIFHSEGFQFGLININKKGHAFGFQFSLLSNMVGGNFHGLQIGLYNYVVGDMDFVQLGFINIAGDNRLIMSGGLFNERYWPVTDISYGLQLSLIANSIYNFKGLQVSTLGNHAENMSGLQASFLFNITKGDMTGLQLAAYGFNSVSKDFQGWQVATFGSNCSGSGLGAQTSLFYNVTSENFSGLQFALLGGNGIGENLKGMQMGLTLNVTIKDVNGTQIGLINIADRVKGVQIGLINYTRRMSGIQIGIINIISEGMIPFLPIINISMTF